MAIDTPARLAILGAGPLGLETALYARFLGYDIVIYERGEVATNVRAWGGERMDTPFRTSCTALGIAAIEAQDESFVPPAADNLLTGREWFERYLLPLSQTDLLADHLRLHTTVIAVGTVDTEDGDIMLTVSSRDAVGQERTENFDGVLDCTGPGNTENWQPPEDMAQYYHILGEKYHDLDQPFRLADGHNQIRHAFAILGDRETLDLYAGATQLLR